VQASLLESTIFTMDLHAARYLMEGFVPKQVGNEHPSGVPTNAYKTRDGYVNIAPIPSMWGRLCKALGREDLTDHPDYATREVRRKRRAEINALIQSITEQMDTATLIAKLQAAEVPCGPIYNLEQAFADPQSKHLGLSQTVTAHDGQAINLPRQPFTLNRTPSTIAVRTPEFAEHTDEILREFGYSADEIATLRKQGAVE
jgi:formyl-CoA transferase